MCEHCPEVLALPENEWREQVVSAISDIHNIAHDEHEGIGKIFSGLIDMAARQGTEILELQESVCTMRAVLATLVVAIHEPTTDETVLATVLATLGVAPTVTTSGAPAPETSKER